MGCYSEVGTKIPSCFALDVTLFLYCWLLKTSILNWLCNQFVFFMQPASCNGLCQIMRQVGSSKFIELGTLVFSSHLFLGCKVIKFFPPETSVLVTSGSS